MTDRRKFAVYQKQSKVFFENIYIFHSISRMSEGYVAVNVEILWCSRYEISSIRLHSIVYVYYVCGYNNNIQRQEKVAFRNLFVWFLYSIMLEGYMCTEKEIQN